MATITFSFTVPDDKKAQVIDEFASQNGYQSEMLVDGEMIPNPQTKTNFSKQVVLRFIKDSLKAYRANVEISRVRQTAIDSVEEILIKEL